MKLNFLHLCDIAFFSQEGKLNVIGVFDRMMSKDFPAISSFCLVLGISGNKGNFKLRAEIVHSETNERVLEIKQDSIEIKEDGGSANFVAKLLGVSFKRDGKYLIKVYIDEKPVNNDHSLVFEKYS